MWKPSGGPSPTTTPPACTARRSTPNAATKAYQSSSATSWLVEAKADSEMNSPVVTAKRDAAKDWVNIVKSAPNIRTRWGYIIASETAIRNASTWDDLKAAAQTHT